MWPLSASEAPLPPFLRISKRSNLPSPEDAHRRQPVRWGRTRLHKFKDLAQLSAAIAAVENLGPFRRAPSSPLFPSRRRRAAARARQPAASMSATGCGWPGAAHRILWKTLGRGRFFPTPFYRFLASLVLASTSFLQEETISWFYTLSLH
jgi:hypothetical protein